jgi:DTW domain-containing protein YfiP
MARTLCQHCQRPIGACICSFISKTNNKTSILVLQHPSEVTQTKGTVALLQRSLVDCQVLVGEDFSENTTLHSILLKYNALLLYPGEKAQELVFTGNTETTEGAGQTKDKPLMLVILDGTWKKAYRMYMLSKNLHSLAQVCLPDYLANNGKYLIRKVAKKNALSSLEATCYALALIDGELKNNHHKKSVCKQKQNSIDCGIYQPLLNKFSLFNQFQLSFRK